MVDNTDINIDFDIYIPNGSLVVFYLKTMLFENEHTINPTKSLSNRIITELGATPQW